MNIKILKYLDFDEAIEEAIKKKIITKKESKIIFKDMTYGREGDFWGMYYEDVLEKNNYDDKEWEVYKKFYEFCKECEISENGEFKRIMFDCSVYS